MTRLVDAVPHAASLIEGLRDFGYSLETSLADIIDNSITAGATRIDITADTASADPWIAITDNGNGMTEPELVEAMRPGSRNPRTARAGSDLGRFGLGLKSASFAQCRKLTVYSCKDGKAACASWDLDLVAERNTWQIDLDDTPTIPGLALPDKNGTVVLWRKLDRLDGGYSDSTGKRADVINAAIAVAERHVCLVFHRFMEGRTPRVGIWLNGRKLKPVDPFASDHPATQFDPPDDLELPEGMVKILSVTLPHHKLMSEAAWKELGGADGHLRSQGFYVYRADRLIIAGGWLGLIAQTELTKLCRVSVDIPNTMDSAWKIDVKKASAQLPPKVRERLKRVVERFVGTSKRTYQRRGHRLVEEQRHPMWSRVLKDGAIIFRPNADHPVFRNFVDTLPADRRREFGNCLSLLGATLPVEAIHADLFGGAEAVKSDSGDAESLRQYTAALVATLREQGFERENIPAVLESVDLLKGNWATVKPMIDSILEGGRK